MKNFVIKLLSIFVGFFFICSFAHALTPIEELKANVEKQSKFSANFDEIIYDEDNFELEHYEGNLVISTASREFRIETLNPMQNLLVSNGIDIYFYDPEINQVTIYSLAKIDKKSPIWLLIDSNESDFSNYNVSKTNDNSFNLSSKTEPKVYTLTFDEKGIVNISVTEKQGQRIDYKLKDRNFFPELSNVSFAFKKPNGVAVDDQR